MSGKDGHMVLYYTIVNTMALYSEILTQLDLSKNEALLYEALLSLGESSAGTLSTKAQVNRRNAYDSLQRLIEKGFVFEIRTGRDIFYQAVDPKKFLEKIDEKRLSFEKVLPDLQKLYQNESHQEDVYVYRGLEGWKNYLRDILRVGQDVYVIGGKGAWSDPRLRSFFQSFTQQAQQKSIEFHVLYDHEVKTSDSKITSLLKSHYRFLPKSYSSPAAIDIFGDHVVISTVAKLDTIDDQASFTVIVNRKIADAYRIWFQGLWGVSEKLCASLRR